MAAPQDNPIVGAYFIRLKLLPADNMERNQPGNRALDLVVHTLIQMYRNMSGVYTKPPGIANHHRALLIPGVLKFTLTVNS
jgi:hypothetical protein